MKYLRIDISKTSRSCLYVKVPDDCDVEKTKKEIWRGELRERVEELSSNLESYAWEDEDGDDGEPERFIDPNQTEMQL